MTARTKLVPSHHHCFSQYLLFPRIQTSLPSVQHTIWNLVTTGLQKSTALYRSVHMWYVEVNIWKWDLYKQSHGVTGQGVRKREKGETSWCCLAPLPYLEVLSSGIQLFSSFSIHSYSLQILLLSLQSLFQKDPYFTFFLAPHLPYFLKRINL